jgi:hypothetical protein
VVAEQAPVSVQKPHADTLVLEQPAESNTPQPQSQMASVWYDAGQVQPEALHDVDVAH